MFKNLLIFLFLFCSFFKFAHSEENINLPKKNKNLCNYGYHLSNNNYTFPDYIKKITKQNQIKTLDNDINEIEDNLGGKYIDKRFTIKELSALDKPNKGKHESIASLKIINNQLYGVSRHGYISKIDVDNNSKFEMLLDMSNNVSTDHSEAGLLDFTILDTDGENYIFLIYYVKPNGEVKVSNILSAVWVGKDKKISKEKILFYFDKSKLTGSDEDYGHNGGNIRYIKNEVYLSLGDFGYLDKNLGEKSYNLNYLIGKIIRIKLLNIPSIAKGMESLDSLDYAAHEDNPFFSKKDVCNEIYSLGFRNPWRFVLDPYSNNLFVGDVGWSDIEEINLASAGSFHGWDIKEGNECLEDNRLFEVCKQGIVDRYITNPLITHLHGGKQNIVAIIGGDFLYGENKPKIENPYIYGDFEGSIHMIIDNKHKMISNYLNRKGYITSFASDRNGKIYFSVFSAPPFDFAKIFVIETKDK